MQDHSSVPPCARSQLPAMLKASWMYKAHGNRYLNKNAMQLAAAVGTAAEAEMEKPRETQYHGRARD